MSNPPNPPNPPYQLFVGVDIAANSATAAWAVPVSGSTSAEALANANSPSSTSTLELEQSPQGYTSLQKRLGSTGITPAHTLLVMEATSTYWVMLASTMYEAGYCVSVINPAQAHYFAKALLKRAKTDKLDAHTLAQLAQTLTPPLWTPPPDIYYQLQQRLALRDNLLSLLGQVRNQLHALEHNRVVIPSVRLHMEELIKTLAEQLHTVEAELKEVVKQDEEWGGSIARLQSIKGVGLITAAWLVVGTLNFTLCPTVQALTSYVGLAPMPHQSGTSVRGKSRIGHSGKRRLRTALYLATLSAARYNSVIRSFYERLRASGKPVKVARCASARKLLHIAWALVKHKEEFKAGKENSPSLP